MMSVFAKLDEKNLESHVKFMESNKDLGATIAEELAKVPDAEAAGAISIIFARFYHS